VDEIPNVWSQQTAMNSTTKQNVEIGKESQLQRKLQIKEASVPRLLPYQDTNTNNVLNEETNSGKVSRKMETRFVVHMAKRPTNFISRLSNHTSGNFADSKLLAEKTEVLNGAIRADKKLDLSNNETSFAQKKDDDRVYDLFDEYYNNQTPNFSLGQQNFDSSKNVEQHPAQVSGTQTLVFMPKYVENKNIEQHSQFDEGTSLFDNPYKANKKARGKSVRTSIPRSAIQANNDTWLNLKEVFQVSRKKAKLVTPSIKNYNNR
jgi:hypothetical protein